ncbi:MAG TPA: hypothetical protein VJX67_03275, partial [Blastocatellia bacterium]|nr:hypothetical protein [Blastocatellia bacterium]
MDYALLDTNVVSFLLKQDRIQCKTVLLYQRSWQPDRINQNPERGLRVIRSVASASRLEDQESKSSA